jgi:hypothetical protein
MTSEPSRAPLGYSLNALHYGLMGMYKLGIFLFVLVPYLVLEFATLH